MDDRTLGLVLRAIRLRRGRRQIDIAGRARISQATVSRAEAGHLDILSLRALRSLCAAMEIKLELLPRWRGAELDRLLDEGHAALVGLVVRSMELWGWEAVVEATYSRYGERGSIDILALHRATRPCSLLR